MSKWINADSLIDKFNSHVGFTTRPDVTRAIKIIKDEPGIDIVRCKECKHFEKNDSILRGEWWCDFWADTIEDDGYCSYGERKEGE